MIRVRVPRVLRYSAVSVALTYVALGIGAITLFAAPLWYAWRVTIQESRAEILQVDAARMAEVFRRDGAEGLRGIIDARVRMQIPFDRILLLADPSLHPLAGNLAAWPRTVPTAAGSYLTHVEIDHSDQSALVRVMRLGGYYLLVGRDNRVFAPLETRFWFGLGASIAVLSLAGLLVGLVTRRALLNRIQDIGRTVSAIIHGDLRQRLPMHPTDDELNALSRTINGMLEQIEQLVHGVRNVSNSIAHDLRTPLAELRSRLEHLALVRPGTAETLEEIDGAVTDVDRVIRIFDALLRLAELDSGMRRSGFVPLDLVDLAATAVEFYAPAAELKNIALSLDSSGAMPASGDPVLLAQALSNLIDNALKYAPQNGEILVSVRRRADDAAEIAVTDSGPGIAVDERAKVVERFYRGDASRGTPGVGLGLSLVQAVAKLHGSTLELKSREGGMTPGLRVVMVLPAGTAGPASGGGCAGEGETAAPRPAPPPATDAPQGAGAAV